MAEALWIDLGDMLLFEDFCDLVSLEYDEAQRLLKEKGYQLHKLDFEPRTSQDGKQYGRFKPSSHDVQIEEGWFWIAKSDVNALKNDEPMFFNPPTETRKKICYECLSKDIEADSLRDNLMGYTLATKLLRDKVEEHRTELADAETTITEMSKIIDEVKNGLENGELIPRTAAQTESARRAREEQTAKRWEEHLRTCVLLALWSKEKFDAGSPTTKKEREKWIRGKNLGRLSDQAERAFNRTMNEYGPGIVR